MKKMKKLLLLFLATTLCLTACQAQNSEPVSEEEEEKIPKRSVHRGKL